MADGPSIEQQAADWLIKEDRGLDFREQSDFDRWLSEDTHNRVAYLRLKRTWIGAGQLSEPRNFSAGVRSRAARVWRNMAGWAVAAMLLVTMTGAAWYLTRPSITTIATGVGQRLNVSLEEGTRIELNTNTVLRSRLSGSARIITMDRGQAFFDVTRDKNRQLVILAGDRRITDIGTRFSIYRNEDNVKVVITEGRVRVEDVKNASARPVEAGANSIVIVNGDETLVAKMTGAEITKELTWRYGLLTFIDEPLESVSREFNRYNAKKIHIAPSARDIKIGGSFRANNVDGFKDLLQQVFALKVHESSGDIFVSK